MRPGRAARAANIIGMAGMGDDPDVGRLYRRRGYAGRRNPLPESDLTLAIFTALATFALAGDRPGRHVAFATGAGRRRPRRSPPASALNYVAQALAGTPQEAANQGQFLDAGHA